MCVTFNKVNGFIRVYEGSRRLILFGPEKYDAIYKLIRYPISQKSGITYAFSHNNARIKVDSYESLPLEKTLTFHIIRILIKLVFNKNQNHFYHNIF